MSSNEQKARAVGVDVGTFFFQTAELNGETIETKTIRNAFIELAKTDGIDQMLKAKDGNKVQYVEDDKHVYVIGEDAIQFARMLPGKVELRRPLQDGVLNAGEEMKMQVLNELIKNTIGKAPDRKSVAVTCVSSPPVDSDKSNKFHESRLRGMFEANGWNVDIIPEGLAVILAENPSTVDADGNRLPYTGIGISFGAGRVNIVVAYRGVVAVGMSASRSGDWIDREVANAISVPLSQITAHKENKLDFSRINEEDDKDFALLEYYKDAIRWNMSQFAKRFNDRDKKTDSDMALDIVVAGGTSKPKGFIEMFSKQVRGMDLPFTIKEIRHAKDPRNTVCVGLMRRAIILRDELKIKDSVEDILK